MSSALSGQKLKNQNALDLKKNTMTSMTKHHGKLMAFLKTGAENPEDVAKYEKHLLESTARLKAGDTSELEGILLSQMLTTNEIHKKLVVNFDICAYTGDESQALFWHKMVTDCSNTLQKCTNQLLKQKKPKTSRVYIRTMNHQVNNHHAH